MIRKFRDEDMEAALAIWLEASLLAHDFIDGDFWRAQVSPMRETYLPASENWVFEEGGRVRGFCALFNDRLAALFVDPAYQGKGIGKALLTHAKAQREKLELSVYKENKKSVAFYLSQGFVQVGEQPDEHSGHLELLMVY